jgi:type IV secretion system protein VirB5
MSIKSVVSAIAVTVLAFGAIAPAHAQWAVIDVSAIGQLVQEVQELRQQVATAQSQLSQAQSEYAAITGNRGMQLLLAGTNRNYLPTDWAQLSQAMSGSSGSYPVLAAEVANLITVNSVLTPAQVSSLSLLQQAQLTSARQSPAMLQALARTALANSSGRFASLQQLVGAIGGAADQKAALDLTSRITAEQGMLQNEQTKLDALYRVADSEERSRLERLAEQAIADQGSLRRLAPMGL